MAEDQIKAIAEKYEEQLTLNDVNTENCPTKEGVIRVLKFLSTRYCMVEREKVIDAFNTNRQWREDCLNSIEDERFDACRAEGAIDTIYHLFGTSMFNQDEE